MHNADADHSLNGITGNAGGQGINSGAGGITGASPRHLHTQGPRRLHKQKGPSWAQWNRAPIQRPMRAQHQLAQASAGAGRHCRSATARNSARSATGRGCARQACGRHAPGLAYVTLASSPFEPLSSAASRGGTRMAAGRMTSSTCWQGARSIRIPFHLMSWRTWPSTRWRSTTVMEKREHGHAAATFLKPSASGYCRLS
jgi:hypothetical protein